MKYFKPANRGCPICGGSMMTGCHPTHRPVTAPPPVPFTPEDWREIYNFMRFVYLPFMHRIAARALARQQQLDQTSSNE